MEEKLYVEEAEKSALAWDINLQAAETEKLKALKGSLENVVSEQNHANGPDKKRFKGDIYRILYLRYGGVASKKLRTFSAPGSHETTELCPFAAVMKRQ